MSDTETARGEGRREGSLDAPTRHPIAWRDPDFYDLDAIEKEMERVFDICHGCRRCFNLCDSFPRLFDLVDNGPTGEMDGVAKDDYALVAEACTLCDMCFMTKCPYVPPHKFDLDFPHLILRYRAAIRHRDGPHDLSEQLGETDRNGIMAKPVAAIANALSAKGSLETRVILEKLAGIDRDAELPKFHSKTVVDLGKHAPAADAKGPAFGKRKAAIYATCFANYNDPHVGRAALAVLAKQGVETKVVYPACCGMPQLEHGDIAEVAKRAEKVAGTFAPLIAEGWDVVSLTASCGLMMKFEWPLILPENEDVKRLSDATRDIGEYIVELSKEHGLAPGMKPVPGGVTLHHACHARAQNMGTKSAEMLRLVPDMKVDVVERCSGHGGTFGVMKKTRSLAIKVGKAAARQVMQKGHDLVCSDCPLACKHMIQLIDSGEEGKKLEGAHPIEIFARSYGIC
jgi:glycerol-3-phosphate dehydrogenase subunit C